jgi:hypothetical protein
MINPSAAKTFEHVRGTTHVVMIGGGPADGFPYSYPTLCGLHLMRDDDWQERPDLKGKCGCVKCISVLQKIRADWNAASDADADKGVRDGA